MDHLLVTKAVFRTMDYDWRSWLWTPPAIALEAYCRLLEAYDFHIKKKNPYIWDMATTTKAVDDGNTLKNGK